MTGPFPMRVEHIWSRGSDLRLEGVYAGHPILTLVKGDQYMTIDLLTRTGISIQRSAQAIAQDKGRRRPFGNVLQKILDAGGENVGSKAIPGGHCEMYRVTDDKGRREVCVSEDEAKLPIVVRIFDRASGNSIEIHYVGWMRGLPIGDAFFSPPPDVQLQHLTYAEYEKRASKQVVGPAPPVMGELLHGQ